MSILYCHPWIGEFGWELCWWNPMVRYYAQQYDQITVAAPESSRYLYEFADIFIPLKTKGVSYYEGELEGEPPVVHSNFILEPKKEFTRYMGEPDYVSTKRLWRHLSPKNPIYKADILCAFRPPKHIGSQKISGKEYPLVQCQKLVDMLIAQGLSVACFGGIDNYCPNGAIDLRGKPLKEQCGAITKAKCVVGPSSGPIHLASLCKCPHVTWIASVHNTLEKRYIKLWNPFNTPMRFVGHSRLPSPKEVMQNVKVLLNEKLD